eukprot:3649209-Pyramimonas_sp.AAC.1
MSWALLEVRCRPRGPSGSRRGVLDISFCDSVFSWIVFGPIRAVLALLGEVGASTSPRKGGHTSRLKLTSP